jgi:hypothetical protein
VDGAKESVEKIGFVDFAAARDEGLAHLDEISAEYKPQLGLSDEKSGLT